LRLKICCSSFHVTAGRLLGSSFEAVLLHIFGGSRLLGSSFEA
jgi:hypothetical protein